MDPDEFPDKSSCEQREPVRPIPGTQRRPLDFVLSEIDSQPVQQTLNRPGHHGIWTPDDSVDLHIHAQARSVQIVLTVIAGVVINRHETSEQDSVPTSWRREMQHFTSGRCRDLIISLNGSDSELRGSGRRYIAVPWGAASHCWNDRRRRREELFRPLSKGDSSAPTRPTKNEFQLDPIGHRHRCPGLQEKLAIGPEFGQGPCRLEQRRPQTVGSFPIRGLVSQRQFSLCDTEGRTGA